MSDLSGSTIAGTYDRLLSLPSGGGNSTNLVALTDGNAGTTFGLKIATTSISINATNRLYLDGDEGTPHTYIYQQAADKLDFVVGGNTILELGEAGGTSSDYAAIQYQNKLYLDGGSDTYISNTAADKIDIVCGGSLVLEIKEAGSASTNYVAIQHQNRLYLDGGSHTYLHEVSNDKVDMVVGGQTILEITENGGGANDSVAVQALNKLYFDGGGDTYLHESSADNLVFVVGSDANAFVLKETGSQTYCGINQTTPVSNLDVVGSFTTGLVTLTGDTSITQALHSGRILLMGEAGGDAECTFTLPDATGTGAVYKFVVSVVNASNYIIKVPDANNTIAGQVITLNDSTAGGVDSTISWPTAATTDTITLDATTKGGASIGDYIELIDIAADKWAVNGLLRASGTEATPFSATVN